MTTTTLSSASLSLCAFVFSCGGDPAPRTTVGATQDEAGRNASVGANTGPAGAAPAADPVAGGRAAAPPAKPPSRPPAPDAGGPERDAGVADASDPASLEAGPGAQAGPLHVASEVWLDGEQLDPNYRCPGPSPALAFEGAPAPTLSYAVVIIDRSNSFFHWVIYDIPADVTELAEGIPSGALLEEPAGARQGAAYNGTRGYVGPCGRNNNPYELTLYALDVASLPDLSESAAASAILDAIQLHALESVAVTAMSGPAM